MARYDATVLVSGGIESVVMAHHLVTVEKKSIRAIHFSLGSPSAHYQLHHAKKILNAIGAPLDVVNMSGLVEMTAGYVDPGWAAMDEGDEEWSLPIGPDKRLSFLPTLIATSVYHANITSSPVVYVGYSKEQARQGIIDFMNSIGSCMSLVHRNEPPVQVSAPFISYTKSDVIALGTRNGLNVSDTWSCYYDGPVQCGTCAACTQRKNAFQAAQIADSTIYKK